MEGACEDDTEADRCPVLATLLLLLLLLLLLRLEPVLKKKLLLNRLDFCWEESEDWSVAESGVKARSEEMGVLVMVAVGTDAGMCSLRGTTGGQIEYLAFGRGGIVFGRGFEPAIGIETVVAFLPQGYHLPTPERSFPRRVKVFGDVSRRNRKTNKSTQQILPVFDYENKTR